MICKKCGNEFDAKFCPNCGTPAEGTEVVAPEKKPKKPIFKRWWFWLIIVAIIVIYLLAANGGKNKKTGTDIGNTDFDLQEEIYMPAIDGSGLTVDCDTFNSMLVKKASGYTECNLTISETPENGKYRFYLNGADTYICVVYFNGIEIVEGKEKMDSIVIACDGEKYSAEMSLKISMAVATLTNPLTKSDSGSDSPTSDAYEDSLGIIKNVVDRYDDQSGEYYAVGTVDRSFMRFRYSIYNNWVYIWATTNMDNIFYPLYTNN